MNSVVNYFNSPTFYWTLSVTQISCEWFHFSNSPLINFSSPTLHWTLSALKPSTEHFQLPNSAVKTFTSLTLLWIISVSQLSRKHFQLLYCEHFYDLRCAPSVLLNVNLCSQKGVWWAENMGGVKPFPERKKTLSILF